MPENAIETAAMAAAETVEAISGTAQAADPTNLTVVLLGLGTVFAGLIGIILICYLTGAIFRIIEKKQGISEEDIPAKGTSDSAASPAPAAAPAAASAVIPNRGEFIAAVSAALAEELGSDVSAIRIISVKKL